MSDPHIITTSLERLAGIGGKEADDRLTRRVLARDPHTVVIQASLPPAADIPPHGLPAGKPALLTLLRGQLWLALGEEFNETALIQIPLGGMAVFRATDPKHFGRTGPDGAEILVVAFNQEAVTGPLQQIFDEAGG